MVDLDSSQRKHLRSLAHGLRPVVRVGKDGLSDAVIRAADDALEHHELVKVQLPGERDERRELAAAVAERTRAACVGQIGRILILYRQQPDPERRRITLPG